MGSLTKTSTTSDIFERSKLKEIRHWIFDMDGTLTQDIHDFEMMKRVLEVPPDGDILTHLDSLPEADYKARHRCLEE